MHTIISVGIVTIIMNITFPAHHNALLIQILYTARIIDAPLLITESCTDNEMQWVHVQRRVNITEINDAELIRQS